jgi:hypothetical protein
MINTARLHLVFLDLLHVLLYYSGVAYTAGVRTNGPLIGSTQMKTLKTMLLALALLLLPALGRAQDVKTLPSEIDLRAAYCIPIVQHIISVFRSVGHELDPPENKKLVDEVLDGLRADLRRLQLYLLPRLTHLTPLGVVVARRRAQEDLAQLDDYGKTCSAKCDHLRYKSSWSSCNTKCQAANPLNPRLQTCSDLGWLPY